MIVPGDRAPSLPLRRSWRGGFRALEGISHAFGAVLSFAVILGLAYLLGHHMLSGELPGSDSPLHVSYAMWLDRYFPDIHHWFPLHGGGVSLLHGYPIASHLLVVVLHRMSGWPILQVFRIVSFMAFGLTAFGIFLLCWRTLKRQVVGLIAAVFYLLSPVSWTWMCNWGFFAQQVGMVFLPLMLLAFDGAMASQLAGVRGGRGRLWFAALVVLTLCGSLCHVLIGAAGILGMSLIVAFSALAAARTNRRAVIRGGVKIILLLILCLGLLTAIYVVPFYAYGKVANREGLNTPPPHQLHRLPVPEFFGLEPIDPAAIMTRMQFPLVVSAFALLGVVMAGLQRWRRGPGSIRPLAFALSLAVACAYALSPLLASIVLKISPMLHNFLSFRSGLLLVMILMPILAAYGVWFLANLIIFPDRVLRRAGKRRGAKGKAGVSISARPIFAWVASLVIAGVGVWQLPRITDVEPPWLPYGPLAGVNLADIWDRRGGYEEPDLLVQISPESWPPLVINNHDQRMDYSSHLGAQLPEGRPLRIDISPYGGQFATDLAIFADASQINSYTFQINLVHGMWGYQQNVFYSREAEANEYGNPQTLNTSAQWFGTEYVLLRAEKDQPGMYREAGWELVFEEGAFQWWRNPGAPPLATLTTRPAILVVGKPETDAYMTVFRLASAGMMPYEQALLVEGEAEVDAYTQEELGIFDALFLYGYDYKKSSKAWETLAGYVEQGGSLFVDTGWEFSIPEWEFESAPEVLPVERLTWTDYGAEDDLVLGAPEITGEIDVELFKPLIWEGEPWMLSGAQASDIRNWGQMVLSAAGRPLVVAGEYGQGRVVWSGFNLIGHILYGDRSQEETAFLANLMQWLTAPGPSLELDPPSTERPHPDQVLLHFRPQPEDITWLYWREAYYPNWHAYLTDGDGEREIPIFRGGPGLMLMPVESDFEEVEVKLVWENSGIEKAAVFPSALGLVLLVAIVFDGLVTQGSALSRLKAYLYGHLPKPFLGQGKTHEWVMAKQAEIEGAKGKVVKGTQEAQAPFYEDDVSDDQEWLVEGMGIQEPAHAPFHAIPEELANDLLAATQDHIDIQENAWAERVLRRRSEHDAIPQGTDWPEGE
ncbi:MAG: hypothetical protein PVJ07_05475 [Anaerolineales bacterium]|jgi:hypothetical protein